MNCNVRSPPTSHHQQFLTINHNKKIRALSRYQVYYDLTTPSFARDWCFMINYSQKPLTQQEAVMQTSINNQLTLKDACEMMKSGEKLFVSADRILNLAVKSNIGIQEEVGQGANKGLEYDSLPCDATELRFNPNNKEEVAWVGKTYFSYGESKITRKNPNDTPNTEVTEISYGAWANRIDDQVTEHGEEAKVPDIRSWNKEFSSEEKVKFLINLKAKNTKEIIKIKNGIKWNWKLSPRGQRAIINLCNRIINNNEKGDKMKAIIKNIARAYTQSYLRNMIPSIKEAGLSESEMKCIRAIFKKKDYEICKAYKEKTGKFQKMIFPTKKEIEANKPKVTHVTMKLSDCKTQAEYDAVLAQLSTNLKLSSANK